MTSLWKADAEPVASTPFIAGARRDAIVVGAGITGLCTAVMLARAGLDVAVIEAGDVGELASGANTGKLSLLQGSVLSTLRRHHPASLVRAYADANRDGADWLLAFAERAGVPYSRRTAYSYAQTAAGVDAVAEELAAAAEAGLDVRRVPAASDSAPFPVVDAVALADQAAIDPHRLLLALARALLDAGGALHTGTRVTRVHVVPRGSVETDAVSASAPSGARSPSTTGTRSSGSSPRRRSSRFCVHRRWPGPRYVSDPRVRCASCRACCCWSVPS